VSSSGPGPIVAIVGPTATGKSTVAVELAQALDGEVVNADPQQFYRGMDIGTAKLTPDERRGVRHHQLDTIDVTEEASVARYQREAREDIEGIWDRGHRPIVVGGSGLYLRALLDRLDIPPTDPQLRARLEARAGEEGPQALHEELARLDPEAAAHISVANTRRIVRALEVVTLTGGYSARLPERDYHRPTVQIGLRIQRPGLDMRISARCRRMWDDGLLEETKQLIGQGLREGKTASRAVGYAEAMGCIDGELTEDEAVARMDHRTRRLARRQARWFGPDPRIHWIDQGPSYDDRDRVIAEALRILGTVDS
jgi:tRNA dimethylallyltransferase